MATVLDTYLNYDSTDQDYTDHPLFWVLFIPQMIPLVELCVRRFPSPLDLTSRISTVIPLLLVAGLFDYGCLIMFNMLRNLFLLRTELCPTAGSFAVVFMFRSWRFGFKSLGKAVWIDWKSWDQVLMVNYLLLLLNPVLICDTSLSIMFTQRWKGSMYLVSAMKNLLWAQVLGSVRVGPEVVKATGIKPFIDLSWLPSPIRILINTVVGLFLRNFLKLLPTLALGFLAGLPKILSFCSRAMQSVEVPTRPLGYFGFLRNIDRAAIQMRGRMLEGIAFHTLRTYKTVSSWLPSRSDPKSPSGSFKTIRLLKVAPAISGPFEIHCTLEHAVLDPDNHPKYTAISYTWGDPTLNRVLIVNGRPVAVSESAYGAVRALRSLWRHELFWIDQVCIDQESVRDKEEQIPLMADIYYRASHVIIWLGPAENASIAINLIHRLWVWTSLKGSTGFEPDLYIPSKEAKDAVLELLQHPWFSRTWVVQEVANSHMSIGDNATINYGGATLPWKRFAWFAIMVLHSDTVVKELTEGDESLTSVCRRVSQHVTTMSSFCWMKQTTDSKPFLFYLVRMFRTGHFQASVAKDRIYAVLALCGLAQEPSFAPDYLKSDAELFIQVAKYIYNSTNPMRKLEFLAHAGLAYENITPGLPSWVPDWSVSPAFYPLLGIDGITDIVSPPYVHTFNWNLAQLHAYGEFSHIHANRRPRFMGAQKDLDFRAFRMRRLLYSACLEGKSPGTTINENQFHAMGYCFDRIASLGSVARADSNAGHRTKMSSKALTISSLPLGDAIREWLEMALPGGVPSQPKLYWDDSPGSAFVQTLCGGLLGEWTDLTRLEAPEAIFMAREIYCLLQHLLAFPSFASSLRAGSNDAPKDDSTRKRDYIAREKIEQYSCSVRIISSGRAFGITEKGKFGLFLPGCQIGDLICVLRDAPVPFVLRKVPLKAPGADENDGGEENRQYQLIGHCYVQGCMHRETDVSGIRHEEFILV